MRVLHFALVLDLKSVFEESCGGDAEDELVFESDDDPRTMIKERQRLTMDPSFLDVFFFLWYHMPLI